MSREKVIVVLPAYNAASTLKRTVDDIPTGCFDEIILVDDGSRDNTVVIARQLKLSVFTHPRNLGYGANQKTCYELALERGAEYIVMLHPDYQYDSRIIPAAVEILKLGICDIILGNRIRTRKECLISGMPLYKYLANRFLTTIENMALGQNLGDFHSGFRAYRRAVLETIPFRHNSDSFVFDTQLLIQAVNFGFLLGDIPVPVRYFNEASSINLYQSIVYGIESLKAILSYYLHCFKLMDSSFLSYKIKREENIKKTSFT